MTLSAGSTRSLSWLHKPGSYRNIPRLMVTAFGQRPDHDVAFTNGTFDRVPLASWRNDFPFRLVAM